MENNIQAKIVGIVLDARDHKALIQFYQEFLGWEMAVDTESYCAVADPSSGITIGAQLVPSFQKPVWPPQPGQPDQGAHCDIQVTNLGAAVKKAESLGARVSPEQFIEGLTVMFDPEGHPFCLFEGE